MFHTARIKLSVLYSIIFLVLFWSLTGGIYFWMNQFFGDSSFIKHHNYSQSIDQEVPKREPPLDVIMDELKNIILLIDFGLLFTIPIITWFLTGRTLAPIQAAHAREKQFLTDASHDLRTPLSIISADIELSLRKKRTLSDYEKTLKSNKEEVDDLIALVENLLFINREDQHRSALQEKIDLIDLLSARIALLQKRADTKNQIISLTPPQKNIIIQGNSHLLNRLFSNLLDNAIKYSPVKANIKVKINYDEKSAVVIISNSGIGIPKKELEKIFDRFYRIDPSRSEKGYGLGLSIAKQIVDMHQGKINIISVEEKETTVSVILPLKQNPGKNLS